MPLLPPATVPVGRCPACDGTMHEPYREVPAHMAPPAAPAFRFSRCGDCRLVFLNPRVAPEALGAYYGPDYLPYRGAGAWGRWAPLVERAMHAMDARRVALVRRQAAAPVGQATRVLDVGCGRPTFLAALRAATGCEAVGVDFSDEGWRREPERWRGLELHEGELAEAPLEGPFDVVTMWHYLEHDYDPAGALRRLRALAAPGARIVIEVPDHGAWTRRLQGPNWAGYHAPRHTAIYEPRSLTRLLERTGWQARAVSRRGTLDAYTLWWLGRQQRRGIDWAAGMEARFGGFLVGKIATWPLFALAGVVPLGVMTAVAEPDG
jgi:SAM-dependent methyltransferase